MPVARGAALDVGTGFTKGTALPSFRVGGIDVNRVTVASPWTWIVPFEGVMDTSFALL